MLNISERRQKTIREMVGKQMPRLWCPPLTHYTAGGEVDRDRMAAHWRFMVPHVNAFLVPGSTGDAWEMQDFEVFEVVALALKLAGEMKARLLLGALKEDSPATRRGIEELLATLKMKTGEGDSIRAMKASRVCGEVPPILIYLVLSLTLSWIAHAINSRVPRTLLLEKAGAHER